MSIRFLAEISQRAENIIYPTPSNGVNRRYRVHEVYIGPPPEESWWTEWGGWYDEYQGTQIELYYSQFLQHVNSMEEVETTPYSVYVPPSGDLLYGMAFLNVPLPPWLYPDYATESENVIPFLSSALDPDNPSRNTVRGVPAATRLEIPSFTVKLSEEISGITLNQGFSLNFHNNDGYIDDDDEWDLFNTPVHLRKATVENPAYEDFKEIRGGYAEGTKTTFATFTIEVSDKLRSMEEPLCPIIRQEDFSFPVLEGAIGKNIPVVYGTKKIDIINLADNRYSSCEGVSGVVGVYNKDGDSIPVTFNSTTGVISNDYNAVSGVYDKNGNSIPITGRTDSGINVGTGKNVDYITAPDGSRIPFKYDSSTGIITYDKASNAVITGYTANRIGEIVRDIITRKTSVQYNASNWNTVETNQYIEISPEVNIAFTSGDVKKAVQDTLKSDMAYFIQQHDGRFTLRKWGEAYGLAEIPAWMITKKPEKDFSKAQENYFSSCTVNYNYTDKEVFESFFYGDMENAAEDRYRKRLFKEYDTDLVNREDAEALAKLLGSRYTVMRQALKVAVGYDTSGIELLDTVILDVTANEEREFAKPKIWAVREVNPAQDILTLEEIPFADLDEMTAAFDNAEYEEDYDQLFADTDNSEYEILVDGDDVYGYQND
jgi:hypothetical protein